MPVLRLISIADFNSMLLCVMSEEVHSRCLPGTGMPVVPYIPSLSHTMQALIFCRTNFDCDNLEKFFASLSGGAGGGGGFK